MQRLVWVLAVFVILACQLPASPCVAGATLDTYVSLGVTGCSVGPQTVNNFSFSNGGAGAIPDTDITVTPTFGSGYYGVLFASTDFTVSTGSVDYLIGFTWDSIPIRGMEDVLDPGDVNILTDGCVGAAFVGSLCSGTPVSVTVNPSQLTDSVFFSPTSILGIANTITESADQGTADFNSIENRAFVTPEPASFLLAGLGMIVVLRKLLTATSA
jgi:PEP-CTERM motif